MDCLFFNKSESGPKPCVCVRAGAQNTTHSSCAILLHHALARCDDITLLCATASFLLRSGCGINKDTHTHAHTHVEIRHFANLTMSHIVRNG